MLRVILVILAVSFPLAFADSGIRHVKCFNEPESIISYFTAETSELDVSLDLQITQNDGVCVMKNKLGRTYTIDWMPAYHMIKLKDMDFGVVETFRIMSPDNVEFTSFDLQKDIPYCIEVTSVWLDNRVRTETSTETCFKL